MNNLYFNYFNFFLYLKQNVICCKDMHAMLLLKEIKEYWFKMVKRAFSAFLAQSRRRSNFAWSYLGQKFAINL